MALRKRNTSTANGKEEGSKWGYEKNYLREEGKREGCDGEEGREADGDQDYPKKAQSF